MLNLVAVAYSSKAARELGPRDLERLLIDARRFNEKSGVTGALLFGDGEFLQYFEGSPSAVAAVYERIKCSSLHHQLVETLNQPTAARQFRNWHMAFAEPAQTVVQQIANEHWAMTVPTAHRKQDNSPGLALLLDFWDTQAGSADLTLSQGL